MWYISGCFRLHEKGCGGRRQVRRFDRTLGEKVPLLTSELFAIRLPEIRAEKSGSGPVTLYKAEGDLGEAEKDDNDLKFLTVSS